MPEIYLSSDDVSVELWRLAVEEGLAGKKIYIKSEHPEDEGFSSVRKSKRDHIRQKIIESHQYVIACEAAGQTPDPLSLASVAKMRRMFDCTDRTVRLAISDARIDLHLSERYRFSSKKGCFVHKKQTERHKLKMKKGYQRSVKMHPKR